MYQFIYYSLVDMMTYITSNLSRNNLPCYFMKQHSKKLRSDHLGNRWYLPSLHETFNIPLIWMEYDYNVLFIIYWMLWASLIHNVGEEIFGDLVFIVPLEGNIIATQDQKILYTYHKWRGGQRGVGYFVYHI